MVNYYKYLLVSKKDEEWGLAVLNAGCTHIKASATYPLKGHPVHHSFSWNRWRVLQEFQIIYITKGKGVFESESAGLLKVNAGTIIFLFPNERHRYQPDVREGWDEYWVGIKGSMIDNLLRTGFIHPKSPCQYIGFNDYVFNMFHCIIEKTKEESVGYQQLVSGAVMYLIGAYYAAIKQITCRPTKADLIVNEAKLLFQSNKTTYSPKSVAEELNISYSLFRRLFKTYTGISPGQYLLQLKIDKACELMRNSEIAIKEIAMTLNFESMTYFSRVFKAKTGFQPTAYRQTFRHITELHN